MKLTVTDTTNGDITIIEVTKEMQMIQVARLIESAMRIPVAQQQVFFQQKALPQSGTVGSHGIGDDDLLLVHRLEASPAAQASSQPAAAQPAQFPMTGDLMDLEAQRAIEERIREENVAKNMAQALEHNPEGFSSVVMLFVDCSLNNIAGVKAFVDSGAQSTIVSRECAERCNILRLMDTRFAGIARGVGTAKIFGRIHLTLLTLGTEVFEVTLTVMDSVGGGYDMLLGLDMMKKHQACIDLRANVLRIGNSEVPFLPEKDIPLSMRSHPEELQQQQG